MQFSEGHHCIHFLLVLRIAGLEAILTSHRDAEIRMVNKFYDLTATRTPAIDRHIREAYRVPFLLVVSTF